MRRNPSLRLLADCLILLSSAICATSGRGATLHYAGSGGTAYWILVSDWEDSGGTPKVPDSSDALVLTDPSGVTNVSPAGLSSKGSIQGINRIEISNDQATYHFLDNDIEPAALEIFLGGGNALWSDSGGGSMIVDNDILLHEPGVTLRFRVQQTGSFIEVNGDVAPTATISGTGTTELILTSGSGSTDPSVIVNGIIADYLGTFHFPVMTNLQLTAGYANEDGIVEVTGLNTYSGRTAVNAATLVFNSIADWDPSGIASALGAPTNAADATIRLGVTGELGTLRYTGSGHSSNRDIDLEGDGGAIEVDTIATGPLVLTGNIRANTSGVKTLVLGGDGASGTIAGVITNQSGNILVEKRGQSTWNLTGDNTYTEDTNVYDGELVVGAGGVVRSDAQVNVHGGLLSVQDSGVITDTYYGTIGASAGVARAEVIGTGSKWTFDNPGNQLRVGETGIGYLTIQDDGLVSNATGLIGNGNAGFVTVRGASAQWNNSNELDVGYNGLGTLDVENGGSVSSDNGSIGLLAGSNGIATIRGEDSIWNNTDNLDVGGYGTGQLTVEDGGTVVDSSAQIGAVSGATGFATVRGDDSMWTTGSGFFLVGQNGFGILNVEDGGVVENTSTISEIAIGYNLGGEGIVNVRGTNSAWNVSSNIYVGGRNGVAGGTGKLEIDDGGTVAVADALKVWGTGTVKLLGGLLRADTLDLSDGGVFQMTGGRLEVSSVVDSLTNLGGTLAPSNSPGLTTISGDYHQQAAATLEIEIGGTAAESEFDVLQVDGSATLAGELDVSLVALVSDPFVPEFGNTFEILSATGGISGMFDTQPEDLPALSAGLEWEINYGTNNVVLAVVLAGLLGDYNNNGTIDAADYTAWRDAMEGGGSLVNDPTPGVDEDDFLYWRDHFGETFGGGGGSAAAVPEPNTLAILFVGSILGLAAWRRSVVLSLLPSDEHQ
jgi:T5SS/PEP-CTERM-associated repeat protein/autotransporter-associated beta strand protein